MTPTELLKHHVTGAIERGEKEAIEAMTTHTIDDFAHAFEVRARRGSGEHFTCLKDSAPEAFTDLVRELHGGSLPNDTTYRMIRQAAEALAERPDADDDDLLELADSLVDVYTADLLEWAASDLRRVALADDAAEDYGLGAEAGVIERLMHGQLCEYTDMLHTIHGHFTAEDPEL